MIHIQLVVKSQILAGGRGLGTFKSGLKGGVHIVKADQVEDIAGMEVLISFVLLNAIKIVYYFLNLLQLLCLLHEHILAKVLS